MSSIWYTQNLLFHLILSLSACDENAYFALVRIFHCVFIQVLYVISKADSKTFQYKKKLKLRVRRKKLTACQNVNDLIKL